MRSRTTRLRLPLAVAALALALCAAARQTPAAQTTAAPPPRPEPADARRGQAQPAWKLTVSKGAPRTVTLKAKDAPLAEIAAELQRRLKTPFLLSPLMQRQRVTLDFTGVPLEGAARMLAPVPYVDYEVSGDGSAPPRPLGVFLYAFNEQPPDRDAVAKGGSEAILVAGNTEEGTEAYEKQRERDELPLVVKFDKNLLTVRARRQPLTVVLAEIANKVDIPFEMKYESSDLVDVNFSNYTVEQAARALSPNVRLYQRVNLTTYESTPLRLLLVQPASSATPN